MVGVSGSPLRLTSEFLKPYAPPATARPAADVLSARIHFDGAGDETGAAHQDFVRSADFAVYRSQVEETVTALAHFCRSHQVGGDQGDGLAGNFAALAKNRFVNQAQSGVPFYHGRLAEFDRAMPALDGFKDIILDSTIPLATRKALALNLAEEIGACADGAVGAITGAYATALKTLGGFRGLLAIATEDLARNTIEAAARLHGSAEALEASGTHYLSQAWNAYGGHYGLAARADPLKMVADDSAFMRQCEADLAQALTPDRIALRVAETVLGAFRACFGPEFMSGDPSALVSGEGAVGDERPLNRWALLNQALESVSTKLGVPLEDLRLSDVVRVSDDFTHYAVRHDPALLTERILDRMRKDQLIAGSLRPLGEALDGGPVRTALYVLGDTAWFATTQSSHQAPRDELVAALDSDGWTSERDDWQRAGADIGPVTLSGLSAWVAAQPDGHDHLPPAAAVRQALSEAGEDSAGLQRIDPRWLGDAETVLALRRALEQAGGTEAFETYVLANFEGLKDAVTQQADRFELAMELAATGAQATRLAQALVTDWRAFLSETVGLAPGQSRLQTLLRQGRGAAITALLPPSPLTSEEAGILMALLRGQAGEPPPLATAMVDGNAAMVEAYGQVLERIRPIPELRAQLVELIRATHPVSQRPALYEAMLLGHAPALAAYGRLLRTFSDLPEVRTTLVDLLRARDPNTQRPALFEAMIGDHASAVAAYGDLLRLFSHIPAVQAALVGLLRAEDPESKHPALFEAMLGDYPAAVRAYGVLLHKLRDIPAVETQLVELLRAWNFGSQRPALFEAMIADPPGAVRAYGDLLSTFNHIAAVQVALVGLLRAEDPNTQRPALYEAMLRGQPDAVDAYRDLLRTFGDLPEVRDVLVELIRARNLQNGRPALFAAMLGDHPGVVRAYGDLLSLFSHIPALRDALVDLIRAENPLNKNPALHEATISGCVKAISAYQELPAKFHHIPDVTAELLRLIQA